jgi:hypothetical protein
VARPTKPEILYSQLRPAAMGTQNLPCETRRYAHLPTDFFDGCNLILG